MYVEKSFDENSLAIKMKTHIKLVIEGNLLSLIKGLYKKPTTKSYLMVKCYQYLPPKMGNKAKISTMSALIQHCIRGPSKCNKIIKRNFKTYRLKKKK